MNKYPRSLWAACLLVLAGCVTNDFKVVDALRTGMTQSEALATIQSYGFGLSEALDRPADGWPKERKKFIEPAWRAGREEERTKKQVARVEYYPVRHGLLGAGELYLFYDAGGRLFHFYRLQIN